MTNMFKKSLIAAAILGVAGAANAGTITPVGSEPTVYSVEGVQFNDNDGVVEISAVLTSGADYLANDVLQFTVEGVDVSVLENDPALISTTGTANFLDVVENRIRFRIQETIEAGEMTLTFDGDVESLSAGSNVSVASTALSNSTVVGEYDASPAARVAELRSQFTFTLAEAGRLSQDIDVSEDRIQFAEAPLTEDSLTFSIASAALEEALDVTGTESVVYTATLNATNAAFGPFIDATATGADAQCDFISVSAAVTSCSADAITFTASTGANTVTLDVSAASEVGEEFSILASTFTLDVNALYGSGEDFAAVASESLAAGSWGLNGAQVNVSYMPYRSGIGQVFNVTNKSDQEGSVSLVVYPENGDSFELNGIATIKGQSITNLAGNIVDALSEHTGVNHRTVANTVRYGFEIIVDAPASAIEVYTAYNVDRTGARIVVNDSNGGGLSKSSN